MATNLKCPVGHTKIWMKGKVPTRQGPKTRYVCYECGRSFYKPKPATKAKSGKKAG